MSVRVSNSIEKCVVPVPSAPIVVGDSASVDVLTDITGKYGEWAARYIQNVGANDCYFCIGADCSPANFNGILAKAGAVNADGFGAGQQLDVSNVPSKVSVFSRGGTTIAVTIYKRNDLHVGGNIK